MSPKDFTLSPAQKEDLLRDLWIRHDARWFLKAVGELGFEAATRLNLAVVKSFGKTEIKRLLAASGFAGIKNMDDFTALMKTAAQVYFPPEHKYEFEVLDQNTLVGRVLECYVYQEVEKAGTTRIHQCAARTRFESWLEACGLEGEVLAEDNTPTCRGSCEIIFRLRRPD